MPLGSHFVLTRPDISTVRLRLEPLPSAIKVSAKPFCKARGVGFEPTCPVGHGISNPTPCQARRPPPASALSIYIILIMFRFCGIEICRERLELLECSRRRNSALVCQ